MSNSNTPNTPLHNIKALFFDCFGTVVDWRSTVTQHLHACSQQALSTFLSSSTITQIPHQQEQQHQIPASTFSKALTLTLPDWALFTAQWRKSYMTYVSSIAADTSNSIPYKTIDEHHLDSLHSLLFQWDLTGLWSEQQVREISLIWHSLTPWPDSSAGITALNRAGYITSTLSNGNISLLTDMAAHAKLEWTHVISAEMFGTYKPNRKVYRGAAEKLGLDVGECGMVAAHLGDLKAAREAGFGTVVYVEREGEEGWSGEMVEGARREGWVDVWVGLKGEDDHDHCGADGLGGFMDVAAKMPSRVSRGG